MSIYDFNPPDEDELDLLIGPEPEDEPYQPEEFDVGGFDQFLEGAADALALARPPRAPRSFLEGLAYGGTRGLATRGQRVQEARSKFERQQAEQQKRKDEQRLRAREKYGERRGDVIREAYKTHAASKKDRENYERETRKLTPQDLTDKPYLGRIADPEGRVALDEYTKAFRPESPAEKRAVSAADRAAAAAQRQADAAERQQRLDQTNTVGKLYDDYKGDRAVVGYQMVRSNLKTAETAAKEASGPGDIAVIFSFMRALEPENVNVVREGEFANARSAAGALQRYSNLPNRFFKGTQLTDEGRRYFLTTMRNTLKARRSDYDLANDQYRRRAEAGGVDPSLFIREFPESGSAQSRARPPLSSFERP